MKVVACENNKDTEKTKHGLCGKAVKNIYIFCIYNIISHILLNLV